MKPLPVYTREQSPHFTAFGAPCGGPALCPLCRYDVNLDDRCRQTSAECSDYLAPTDAPRPHALLAVAALAYAIGVIGPIVFMIGQALDWWRTW